MFYSKCVCGKSVAIKQKQGIHCALLLLKHEQQQSNNCCSKKVCIRSKTPKMFQRYILGVKTLVTGTVSWQVGGIRWSPLQKFLLWVSGGSVVGDQVAMVVKSDPTLGCRVTWVPIYLFLLVPYSQDYKYPSIIWTPQIQVPI